MECFTYVSKLSNSEQTASNPTIIIELYLMTYFSPGGIRHEYAYPCQRIVLFLHR